MDRPRLILKVVLSALMLFLAFACAPSEQQVQPTAKTPPSAQVATATSVAPQPSPTAQTAHRDTVNWSDFHLPITPGSPNDDDPELLGEKLGLIGPIITTGGRGRKAFIAVYDAGGVLIGTVYQSRAQKHPEILLEMINLAQMRSAIQAEMAIRAMARMSHQTERIQQELAAR